MKQQVYRYQLRTLTNSWLGDVILTSDGCFFARTDWGNFNYHWDSAGDIREFILRIDGCYFSGKMLISTDERSKKLEMKCYKFSEKILPALKEAIKKELEAEV